MSSQGKGQRVLSNTKPRRESRLWKWVGYSCEAADLLKTKCKGILNEHERKKANKRPLAPRSTRLQLTPLWPRPRTLRSRTHPETHNGSGEGAIQPNRRIGPDAGKELSKMNTGNFEQARGNRRMSKQVIRATDLFCGADESSTGLRQTCETLPVFQF